MHHAPSHTACVDVSTATVDAQRAHLRIVDVREPNEFHGDLDHIPGAELVPLATLVEAARAWPQEQELVVVCRSGGRSARAADALVRLGFTQVRNMLGGMAQWRREGRETTR